jgi:2-iminobutanoate/2-iminopropanoate deaminase
MIKQINTNTAPQAVGPYSQGVATDTLIFCSGQIGLDPKTGELVEGIENQTRQVMKNLSAVLSASGSGFSSVVKTTIYLKNISDFTVVNTVYGEFFTNHKPARATFAVLDLPKSALIEIEAIASV